MEIDSDDEILRTLARGQPIDYAQWPGLLERLPSRMDRIIQEDFPLPPSLQTNSQTENHIQAPSSPLILASSQQSTTSTNKENTPPPPAPPPPTQSNPSSAYTTYTSTLLSSILSTLRTNFPTHPPHTIQRLSELLLTPKPHYRSLPAYLHALDRVIHVTSPLTTFPLPPAIPDPSSASAILSNGASPAANASSVSWGNPTSSNNNNTLGSDEALGGALLTPISWLTKTSSNHSGSSNGGSPMSQGHGHAQAQGQVRTENMEMVEGPNGLGGVETVSVSLNGVSSTLASSSGGGGLRAEGGVTQGELLRQEQRAGVVPATQLRGLGTSLEEAERERVGDENGLGEEDEVPHARGPEEIGMEDMGPQDRRVGSAGGVPGMLGIGGMGMGIDVEAAVGRKAGRETDEDADEEMGGGEAEDEEGEEASKRELTPKRAAEEDIGAVEKRVKEDTEGGEKTADEAVTKDAESEGAQKEKDTDADTEMKMEAEAEGGETSTKVEEKEKEKEKEKETEMEIVDADGKAEGEKKIGEGGENVGADPIDTSTV
ncbi:phosphatase 4 core regulatory subunit R2 protein [Rutstroemia sp. NJR-2017a WRK4]|nr:phosphatase 4 core regulatory subunit R2 protein [Rutstroemia sp. NJR-2017a WRK4]